MIDDEFEVEAIGIDVDEQPIALYKVLKMANAVNDGGQAKMAIAEGYVAVNGEIERRKRRKVYDQDVIQFNQEFYLVICDRPVSSNTIEANSSASLPSAVSKGVGQQQVHSKHNTQSKQKRDKQPTKNQVNKHEKTEQRKQEKGSQTKSKRPPIKF